MNLNKLKSLVSRGPVYEINKSLKKLKKEINKKDSNINKEIEEKFKNDTEKAISLSLSENSTTDLTFNQSSNNNITTIDEFDSLLKASILSLGGNNVLENKGGGNCLFHTFSAHLNVDHQQLRKDAVDYITLQWDKFKDFALRSDNLESFDSKESYSNYMSQDGVWGDHLSVMAICELYQVNAVILVINNTQLSEPIKVNVGSTKTVLIKFNSEFHYEAVI